MSKSARSVEASPSKEKKIRLAETRVYRVQLEIIRRYNEISNLYVSYFNSSKSSDVYGREFFHAVGEILQGVPVDRVKSELYHIGAVDAVVHVPDETDAIEFVKKKWIKPNVALKRAPRHLLQTFNLLRKEK
jgi:hypothetical protein